MTIFLSHLNIGVEEGAKYIPFFLAAALLFRLAHFPDIGIIGTFLLGACSLALSNRLGLSPAIGLTLSILFGTLGGILTGFLFINCKLNSLICGIITLYVSYSCSFLLLGFESSVEVSPFINDEITIALIGLLLCVALCLFFSTKYGLSLRIAGESPSLLLQLRINPNKHFFFMLALGNAISALSGGLAVGLSGSVNIRLGDDKLFEVIIALVLGEGFLSILFVLMKLSLINKIFKGFMSKNISWIRKIRNIFSGTGSVYILISAVLGSFSYWIIFILCSKYFGSNEYSRLVLGINTAFLLIISTKLSMKYHRISFWSFHGYIK